MGGGANGTVKARWFRLLVSTSPPDLSFLRLLSGIYLSCLLALLCPKLLNGFDLKSLTFSRNSVKYLTSNFNLVSIFGQITVKF